MEKNRNKNYKLYWIDKIISKMDKTNWGEFKLKYNREFDFYYDKSINELQNIYIKICQIK